MNGDAKQILEEALADLLGFEDGTSDILDHLLTIESREDLSEYLSQLLGDESPAILEFVDNVGLCQRGEPLTIRPKAKLLANSKPPQKTKEPPKPAGRTTQPAAKQQPASKQNNTLQARRMEKQGKSRVPPPKVKKNPPPIIQSASKAVAPAPATKPQPVMVEKIPVQKTRPTRGKATLVCGCFGAIHAPLTNCLLCGRISCTKEGYGFCAFCGYMVEEVKDGVNDNDKAWVQKERLLRFDKDFARRTEIFDDQEDYQAPTTWMTAEEEQQSEDKQSQKLQALKRPKQSLNLAM